MQVGDYVDTLLLPSSGLKNATVRWVPGPGEITGMPYSSPGGSFGACAIAS